MLMMEYDDGEGRYNGKMAVRGALLSAELMMLLL